MRNLKKVLTLVLTVAMLLSVMVVGTGAAFSDQDSIKNKEAVDVCTTLNIIAGMEDGSYRPANNVTRAQMCKMICVALNGGKEPTLGTNATPTFSDVRTDPSSSWAESFIESCNSQGIVSGVGGGRFSPSGSVTGTQAARMLLVALGYRADQEGFTGDAWAINVNTLASSKGLYKGIESIDANAALSRDNAAQMIWNALNAYEVEYVSQLTTVNGQLTSELVAQDKVVGSNRDKITMLEDKYEAETAIGTFAGNSKMISALKSGNIRIEGVTINGAAVTGVCDFASDLDLKYIGEEVKVLYRDSIDGRDGRLDEKDTIYGVYVTGATTVYNIVKDDIQKVTTNKIKFGDVEHEYVNGAANAIVKNYGALASETMNPGNLNALAVASGDTIKFIENENGKIERAYVVESHISKVSAVNSTKLTIPGVGAINISDNGNDIYDSPAKDDVVVYTQLYKANKDDATFVVTKAETVSGTMKSYKDLEKVSIDGTTYFVDATELVAKTSPSTGKEMKDLTEDAITEFNTGHLEEAATLYLINGFVGAADSQATSFEYALVTAANNMSKVGNAISGAKVQLLTLDGKAIYDVDEDTKDNFVSAGVFNDSKLVALETTPAIVKYTKVSDTSVEIKDVIATKATNTTIYDKDTKQLTIKDDGTKMVVASDAVFFTSTSANGDYKAYNLRSLGNISTRAASTVYYALNSDGDAVVVAFAELQGKPTGASSDTKYGMVTDVERNVKIDGTNYNKYVVWAGEELTIYVKDLSLEKGAYIYFDKTSDDTYGSSDIKVADGTGNSVIVRTVKYEEGDKLLTYKTMSNNNNVTKAVVSDVKITYVNRADKKAGDDIGINKYDEVNGYANAMIIVDSDGKIEGIIVDVNDDILNAGEVATVKVSVAAKSLTLGTDTTVTIAAQPNASYVAGDKVSIVATSTDVFADKTTYTLTTNKGALTAVGTGENTLTFQYNVTSADVTAETDITLTATNITAPAPTTPPATN